MFDGLQILSNTTKYDQTRSNSTKQGVQTVECLATKHLSFVQALTNACVWTVKNVLLLVNQTCHKTLGQQAEKSVLSPDKLSLITKVFLANHCWKIPWW